MSAASPARTRRPSRGQDGVALVTVLAVVAFTSLVIGGLLGLLTTTMRVTSAAETTSRESRAADAAIDTAINQMRTEPCEVGAQPFLGAQVFDQGTPGTSDDVEVEVSCRPTAGSVAGTDQVRVIGTEGYQGALRWRVDCAVDAAAEGCLPWSSALGSTPGGLAQSRVSLIHSGPEPLQFASGVSVRTGAAALRNPTTGSPAIDVGGEYVQGDPGLLSSDPDGCGLLAGNPGGGAGQIDDADAQPVCGDEAVRQLSGDPTGPGAGLIAPATPPNPPVPTTCSGPVVSFAPATYNAAATAAVSRLLDGSVSACRNRTFHFTPGIYAFEGQQLVFGDAGSYYVFGAPTSWSPSAGVAADPSVAGQPDAQLCDPTASGASLVINGWTALRHLAGRVAICPAVPVTGDGSTPEPHPAIYQQPAVPTGVQVVSINRAISGNPITLPFRCRTGTLLSSYPETRDINQFGVCQPQRRYELNLQTDGQAPVSSLRVMLDGFESDTTPNNLLRNRQTRFTVRSATNAVLCQTSFSGGTPNGGLTSSYDLMQMPGSCTPGGFNQSQLDGARIIVDHRMTIDAALLDISQLLTISDAQVEVNAVSGLFGSVTSTDWNSPAAVLTPGLPAASPVMANDCTAFVCAYPDPGRSIVRVDDHEFVHEMVLSDVSLPGLFSSTDTELDPRIETLRAVVKFRPSNATLPSGWPQLLRDLLSAENFLIPVAPQLELRSPDGARCITQAGGLNSDTEVAFDLLDLNLNTPGAPNCNNFLFEHASDLDDVTLTLRFVTRCVPNWFNGFPQQCLRSIGPYNPDDTSPVWQLRPPDIEHVRLTTVTDTYAGPPPNARVTLNATAGVTGSSFNVYGRTWMPTSDLDLHWNGAVTAAPIFGGDLVLHGLASRMAPTASMGVVCCSPPDSRTVDLTARIDGIERLVVRVAFIDVVDDGSGNTTYSPGWAVDVLDYRSCGRGGCAAVLGQAGQNPAVQDPP